MERLARTAIQLDPYDALAYSTLGFAISSQRTGPEAAAAVDRSLELGPSYADILVRSADTLAFEGQAERAAGLCDRAVRLNPSTPAYYFLWCTTPWFLVGRYQAAIDGQNRYDKELNQHGLAWRAAVLRRTRQVGRDCGRCREAAPDVSGGVLRVPPQQWLDVRPRAGPSQGPGQRPQGGPAPLRDRCRAGGLFLVRAACLSATRCARKSRPPHRDGRAPHRAAPRRDPGRRHRRLLAAGRAGRSRHARRDQGPARSGRSTRSWPSTRAASSS